MGMHERRCAVKPTKRFFISVSIVLASLLFGCGPAPAIPVMGGLNLPDEVALARDTATLHLANNYGSSGLLPAITWQATELSRPDLANMRVYQFRNSSWLMTVRVPNDPTQNQQILFVNTRNGFTWAGLADANGNVFHLAIHEGGMIPVTGGNFSPSHGLTLARNNAMQYIAETYALPNLPDASNWGDYVLQRPGLTGQTIYSFNRDGWIVTIRVPANTSNPYEVTFINPQTGFVWAGQVDAAGTVTEISHYIK